MTTLEITRLDSFENLTMEKRELEQQLAAVKKDLANVEEGLLQELQEKGIQNIKTNRGNTVYLNREIFASIIGDKAKAVRVFRWRGLKDLVKTEVNSQTLRAYVRELCENEGASTLYPQDAIPQGLQPYINATEIYRLRMRS